MSWLFTKLDGGSEGLMSSSDQTPRKGEGKYVTISNGKRRIMQERIPTKHGMPDAVVVHERPR